MPVVNFNINTRKNLILKVGGNEKNGGPGRRQMLGNGLGPW